MHKSPLALFALVCAACWPGAAPAQDFPHKSVRFVVPFPPGGATDGLARILGEKMTEAWKQQVVIDNRPGAGGNIAAELVAKAPADGHTIFINGLSHAANVSLYSRLNYHPLRDFAPISQVVAIDTFLTVHPSLPVRSVKELLVLAKARPGTINYASGGNGSSPHMAMELFKGLTGANLVHVPYKGTESVIGMLRGEAAVIFENLISVGAHIKAGKLRAIAVGSAKRSPAMPHIPTVAEAGVPGYEMVLWFGVLAPAGTPKPVVAKIQRDIAAIVKLPDVQPRLAAQAANPVATTPEEFEAFIKQEVAKWAKVVQQAKLKLD
jgi:tripartite-type tricarboxylate transporter receptor subunit TctC